MEPTTQQIPKSTIVFSVGILALAILVVWQQMQISQISNTQSGSASNTNRVQQPVFNQVQAIKDSLLMTKTVSGTVVSSTASEVVVKTRLVNLSALDKFDFTKSQELPSTEKNVTIKITKDTKTSGGALADGKAVSVQTKESVYGSGALTAVSISIIGSPKATAGSPTP